MLSDSITEQKLINEDVWTIKIGVADSNFEVTNSLIPLNVIFKDGK